MWFTIFGMFTLKYERNQVFAEFRSLCTSLAVPSKSELGISHSRVEQVL